MSADLRVQLAASWAALRAVAGNPAIQWLEAGWTISNAASWVFQVAIMIVAYRVDGATAVAGVGVARMVPAMLAAPLAGMTGQRLRGERGLVAVHLVRAAAVALAGVTLVTSLPAAIVLVSVAVESAAAALVRPIQTGLMPALARTPGELVASNVASSTGEGLGSLAGPAVGGFVTAAAGAPAACLVGTALLLGAAGAAVAIRMADSALVVPTVAEPFRRQFGLGLAVLRRRPLQALLIGTFFAQTVVRGAMNVLLVVTAIRLLGLGDSGVGTLNFAVGLGGFFGAIAALTLVGRSRLSAAVALGLVFWGLPLTAIGVLPTTAATIAVLVVLGASNAVLDVAGFTLVQRTLPNAERVAVLAIIEVVAGAGIALGSVIAPPLLEWLGPRGALIVTGALLPVIALATWPTLRRIDDDWVVPARELRLLCGLPMFAPLPLTVIERLATDLTRVDFPAGATLMRQGEPGDRFYLIEDGDVAIEKDGHAVPLLGPLSAVGEIALLRNVPRTATVRAVTPTVAFALSAPEFLAAVTGNRASAAAAAGVVDERLAAMRSEPATKA